MRLRAGVGVDNPQVIGGGAGGGGFAFVSATKWAVTAPIGNDPSFVSFTEVKFLTGASETSQPGTGTAIDGGGSDTGVSSSAFDGDTGTFYGFAPGGIGSGYVGFQFDEAQTITHVELDVRTSWQVQAPRHMKIYYDNGSGWVEYADFPGLPAWSSAEQRQFSLANNGYEDEDGGHRYWRMWVDAAFSGTTWSVVELEWLASGSNIALQYNALIKSANVSNETNAFDGVEGGDSFVVGTALDRWVGVDFGRDRVVEALRIQARSNASFVTQLPKTGLIEYSDDNVSWTTALSFDDLSGNPSASEKRTHTI